MKICERCESELGSLYWVIFGHFVCDKCYQKNKVNSLRKKKLEKLNENR